MNITKKQIAAWLHFRAELKDFTVIGVFTYTLEFPNMRRVPVDLVLISTKYPGEGYRVALFDIHGSVLVSKSFARGQWTAAAAQFSASVARVASSAINGTLKMTDETVITL